MEKGHGLIYGLTNPYFKGMVKIGVTRRLDINRRIHELGTAVPAPFVCAFAFKVPLDRLFEIEHLLHDTFEDKRVEGSEFFRIDTAKAENLLRNLGNFEPMQAVVQEAINLDTAKRRKNMDFFELGLKAGDTLYFKNDPAVTCAIATNRKVLYNGHEVSLSNITKQLLGYAAQPSPYWRTESGTLLSLAEVAATIQTAGELAAAQDEIEKKCNSLL